MDAVYLSGMVAIIYGINSYQPIADNYANGIGGVTHLIDKGAVV